MVFAEATSIFGVKNRSPTQTKAIVYYKNIPSDLHLALGGLCISLVVFKNQAKIGLLLITMVTYVFLLQQLQFLE